MIRYNPLWEMETISREMDKMMNTFKSNPPVRRRSERSAFNPKVDIYEENDNFYFKAEIPGVGKDDVKISVNKDNVLTIKGEKKFEKKDQIKSCCRNERAYGEFHRSFQLPDNADADGIKADFKNGLLNLTVPKKAEVRTDKEITIE